jgi:hypothetical protein
MSARSGLPPNPFSRQPVRTRERLAGRSEELDRIGYYLRLTAADDSPHVALIGSRGVGKTSFLNIAAEIARDERLLVVRLDLDEGKTSAPGLFWQDFYAALLLAAGEAGLWGGSEGPIYSALFQMIHARRLSQADEMVLHFPVVLASATQSLDELHCSDPLIARDINETKDEAKRAGYKGLAVLIDEADCLGRSRELIQVCRNVFQRTPGCSLVLCGTESVFPTLTEVFSPIPRQFHRIDIKPFDGWWGTWEFLKKGLRSLTLEQRDAILPRMHLAHELHDLCGGDPSELQLYCHHMYRLVETENAESLDLTPEVFRAVLYEYRANTPKDLNHVLRRIEALPETLLCGTWWLSRRKLSLPESTELVKLRCELEPAGQCDEAQTQRIDREVERVYAQLHGLGITEEPGTLRLIGGAFTEGFWKAFVEADKGKRWSWDDSDFGFALLEEATRSLRLVMRPPLSFGLRRPPANGGPSWESMDVVRALEDLRRGLALKQAPLWWFLPDVVIKARKQSAETVSEIRVGLSTRGREVKFIAHGFNADDSSRLERSSQAWMEAHHDLLAAHGISAQIEEVRSWHVPSDEEVHKLAFIGDSIPREGFGPTLSERAFERFHAGDYEGAAERFAWMVQANPDDSLRNNLAYCSMLLGRYTEAEEQFRQMRCSKRDVSWPLWTHNRGVLAALKGDKKAAQALLERSLADIRQRGESGADDVVCMLIFEHGATRIVSKKDIPRDAAVVLNLCALGTTELEDLKRELASRWPDEYRMWLGWIGEGQETGE